MGSKPLAEGSLCVRVFLLAEGNIGHGCGRIIKICLAVEIVVLARVEFVGHGGGGGGGEGDWAMD